jgi:hypothetical protein
MSMRNGLLLAGLLAVAGTAAAKPPELPAEPLVQGREASPIAREFFQPEPRPGVVGSLRSLTPNDREPMPLGKLVRGMQGAATGRLTIPLGPIPAKE